jgi:thioesterase domain-containing protein
MSISQAAYAAALAVTDLSHGPPDGVPVYLIHPVSGTLMCYLPLARALAADHPVRGLASPLLSGIPLPGGLADLTAAYATRIRSNADGPCVLGGWSFGATAAYEIAQRLCANGADVPLLVMLDAPPPGSWHGPCGDEDLAWQFLRETERMTGTQAPAQARPGGYGPLGATHELLRSYDPDLDRAETERRFAAFREHSRSLLGHHPASPYPGQVLLVDADPGKRGCRRSDDWRPHLAGSVHQLAVDADHYDLVSAAAARETAAAVRHALRNGA